MVTHFVSSRQEFTHCARSDNRNGLAWDSHDE